MMNKTAPAPVLPATKKHLFSEIKSGVLSISEGYYTDNFDFNDPLSNNHFLFDSMIESLDDLITYYNSDLLSDFDNLKESSKKKLNDFLRDQSVVFLFEHDLKVARACDYYSDKKSFLTYKCDEYESYLYNDLSFKKLTEKMRDNLESELNIYIPKNSTDVFYFYSSGFELTLPKTAILREYKEYKRGL